VLWALKSVQPGQVRRVIAYGGPVLSQAQAMGLEVLSGDANRLDFQPSEVGLSVHYPARIGPSLLSRYRRLYNLHPGYLPWGRGLSSVNWALWEGSPAGATLHEMNEELDAGPIVDRIEVEYGPDDLCGDVQQRVHAAERDLFRRYWSRIAAGEVLESRPQTGPGSVHTRAETAGLLRKVRNEENWRSLDTAELFELARSFGTLELAHGGRVLRLHLTAGPQG
jgi:methionyl-tRNA formyltransferase